MTLGAILVIPFLMVGHAQAAVLDPSLPVTTCGEIASAGTYTLSGDFNADASLDANGTCFIVDQIGGTVTIDGASSTVSATSGGLAIDARAYNTPGDTTSGFLDGGDVSGTTLVVQNITFSGFSGGINASGDGDTDGNGQLQGNGGSAASITVTNSDLGSITADGGNGNNGNYNGGAPGNITVTSSVVGNLSASGGGSNGSGSNVSANGGTITISDSTIGNLVANGGSSVFGTNGGSGGSIILNSSGDLDLSGKTISVAGGTGDTNDGYSNGANGTFTINYSGTLTTTGATLSALSDLSVNSNDFGSYVGGVFPLFPGTISSCGPIITSGTYTLGTDISGVSGTCFTVEADGVTIDGAGYTITASGGNGNVAINASGSGGIGNNAYTSLTIENITLTGFGGGGVVANGDRNTTGSVSNSGNAGNGGDITITDSTLGSITSDGGSVTAIAYDGSGGTITITDSITGDIHSDGGGSRWYEYAGSGGTINISGTNMDLTNKNISAEGGLADNGDGYPNGSNGVLNIDDAGTLVADDTTVHSDFSSVVFSGTVSATYSPVFSADVFDGASITFSPRTLYFNNRVSTNWDDLGNWWTDSGFSEQATTAPRNGDTVYIGAELDNGPASAITVTNAYVADAVTGGGSFAVNFGSNLYGPVTFEEDSTNNGEVNTATFTAYSQNTSGGTVLGDATFTDDAYNSGIVDGNATFGLPDTSDGANNGGTVEGNATFNDLGVNEATVNGRAYFSASTYDSNTNAGGEDADPTGVENGGYIGGGVEFTSDTPVTFILHNIDVWSIDSSGWNFDVPGQSWQFNDYSTNTGNVNGDAYFEAAGGGQGYSYNSGGTIEGNAYFEGSVYDSNGNVPNADPNIAGTIYGTINFTSSSPVSFDLHNSDQWYADTTSWNFNGEIPTWNFYDYSQNNSTLYGYAYFGSPSGSDSSNNDGTVIYPATFYAGTYNNGTVGTGNFYDSSYNNNYVSLQGNFYSSSYNYNTIASGVFNDNSANEGSISDSVTFNGNSTNYSGYVYGDATFNDTTINESVVYGNAFFNNYSENQSAIYGNFAIFNDSSVNQSDGYVSGLGVFFSGATNSGGSVGNPVLLGIASGDVFTNEDGSYSWGDTGAWQNGVIPTDGDNVVLLSGVTLSGNVTNDLYPVVDNTTIDGSGAYTLTGNIYADGSSLQPGANGHVITVQNLSVTGNISANGSDDSSGTAGSGGNITLSSDPVNGNVTANGGGATSGTAGAGGTITIGSSSYTADIEANAGNGGEGAATGGTINVTNSVIGNITANGSDGSQGDNNSVGGNGGSVTIDDLSSGWSTITADGGTGGNNAGGNGGSFTMNGATLPLQNRTVTLAGGSDDCSGSCGGSGTDGTLNLNYSDLQTNNSTIFYSIAHLVLNGSDVGTWNGIFNPISYYFYDGDTALQPSATEDGDWNDTNNWYTAPDYSTQDGNLPTSISPIVVNSSITTNGGSGAVAYSAVFSGTSVLGIPLTVEQGASFSDSSVNNGDITGNVSFNNSSVNTGTVSGLTTINENVALSVVNQGGTLNDVLFNGTSYNDQNISGNATFPNSSYDSNIEPDADPTGVSTGHTIGGTVTFTSGTPVTFTLRGSDVWNARPSDWTFTTSGPRWVFNDGSSNSNSILTLGGATFNATSTNSGTMCSSFTGASIFLTDNENRALSALNQGTINCSIIFNGSSYNDQTVSKNATFNGTSYNAGIVSGTATFTASSFDSNNIPDADPTGISASHTITGTKTFTSTSTVTFTLRGSDIWNANPSTWVFTTAGPKWIFDDSSSNHTTIANAGSLTFNDSSTNVGTSTGAGSITFNASSTNSGLIAASSLLAGYWQLNELSSGTGPGGTDFIDSSGNGNSGVAHGSITYGVTGHQAGLKAISSGTSGYIQIPDSSSLDPKNTMSLSIWEKAANSGQCTGGSGTVMVEKGTGWGAGTQDYGVSTYEGYVVFEGSDANGLGYYAPGVCDGSWHNLVEVYSGNLIKGYIDGSLVASGSFYTLKQYATPLYIARAGDNRARFNGSLDSVMILTVALTDAQVQSLYTTGIPPVNPGTVVFNGDNSNDNGTTTNEILTRVYTTSVATVRNFLTDGGYNSWVVVAQGAVVDLTNAVYNVATDIFKALSGGFFISNPFINGGAHVTPTISIAFPTSGTITKWTGTSINWDTASTCIYSYNNFASTTAVNCANNGSDILRPTTSATSTLSIRGTDSSGNYAEASVTYSYINNVPTYTTCGADIMDEATRPYYYLAANATGTCTATVPTQLRGNASSTLPGYTLTGSVNSSGYNITLRNITVTNTVSSMATTTTVAAGNISIYNSIVGTTTASGVINGGGSGNGGSAGTIYIATSTVSTILAMGGTAPANGGNGGAITIYNATSTLLDAVGGNSTSCGLGGDGGTVNIFYSLSYGTVLSNGGVNHSGVCGAPTGSGGGGTVTVSNPSSGGGTPPAPPSTPPQSGAGGGTYGNDTSNDLLPPNYPGSTLPRVTLPINPISPLVLPSLPNFGGTATSSFNFLIPISNFLFPALPDPLKTTLSKDTTLNAYLASQGFSHAQDLAGLVKKPLPLVPPKKPTVLGLFSVVSGGKTLPLYLIADNTYQAAFSVNVTPYATMTVSLIPTTKGKVTGKYMGKTYTFTAAKKGSTAVTLNLSLPFSAGTYLLTTSASPLPLAIVIPVPPQPVTATVAPKQTIIQKVVSWVKGWF